MDDFYTALEEMGMGKRGDDELEVLDEGKMGGGGGGGGGGPSTALSVGDVRVSDVGSPAPPEWWTRISGSWFDGPVDAGGRLVECSERPLLCMDVLGDMCVVGSADHGLKVGARATRTNRRA